MNTPIIDATDISIEYVDIVDRWEGQWHEWRIELTYLLEVISVNYYTHSRSDAVPTKEEVIYALTADDSTIQLSESFDEWCNELGYDNDSITDRNIYDLALANSAKIRNLYKYYYSDLLKEVEDA